MDITDYNCSVRQDDHKNDKLKNSFFIRGVDSGYDSICSSVLTEKSFNRGESFDIFSPPDFANRTPIKQSTSTLKYHASTPKNSTSVKRHLYNSFTTRSLKRSRSENDENEPKTANTSVRYLNDSGCSFPLKTPLHNTPQKCILNSTSFTNNHHQLSFITESPSTFQEYSTRYQDELNQQIVPVPERPSKTFKNIAHFVKHSRRKLNIPTVDENDGQSRILYYNGTRYLNIIGKLAPLPSILDDIFKKLSSKDLLNVSLVSKNWNALVTSNRCANSRIKQYLNESRNTKENLQEPIGPAIVCHKRQPFKQFNLVSSTSNKNPVAANLDCSSSFIENQNIVQQLNENDRLIKCPRCGRGSIISNCATDKPHSKSLISVPSSTTSSDLTFINKKSDSICAFEKSQSSISEEIGICTSVACQYEFCLKCFCDFHPGERCKISEPESPSKLLICYKKVKSNKNKANSKPNSKRQSLRRLCFS